MSHVSKKERLPDTVSVRDEEAIANAYSMAVAGLGFCTVVRLRQAKLSWQGSAQASPLRKVMDEFVLEECGLYFSRLLDHDGFPFLFDHSALLKMQTLQALEWTALVCVCWPVLHQYFVHGG